MIELHRIGDTQGGGHLAPNFEVAGEGRHHLPVVPGPFATLAAARRDDRRWRASVRFEERGRARTAPGLLAPDVQRSRSRSSLGAELSAPWRRASRQ